MKKVLRNRLQQQGIPFRNYYSGRVVREAAGGVVSDVVKQAAAVDTKQRPAAAIGIVVVMACTTLLAITHMMVVMPSMVTPDQRLNQAAADEAPQKPLDQLEFFLEKNPDTPGARFVHSLREHLHVEEGAEADRIVACRRKANLALCYGGWKNYMKAGGGNKDVDPKNVRLAFYEDDTKESAYTVDRYVGSDYKIPSLGTHTACLPLMLAGHSAASQDDANNLVLELGPFAGLSSKCIAMGLRKNNNHTPFYVYDAFEGKANFKAIQSRAHWVKKDHPEFNEKNTSFQFLWEKAVKPIYPEAKPVAAWINKDTLNNQTLGVGDSSRQVSLLSIDSAKNGLQLMDQTEGLATIKKGTILFLMDYEYVRETVKQTYGCLRENHLLPVYVSWQMEHWAFVVMEDFSLQDAWLGNCFRSIAADLDNSLHRMESLLDADLAYLEGLSDGAPSPKLKEMKKMVREGLVEKMKKNPQEYSKLANLYAPAVNGESK